MKNESDYKKTLDDVLDDLICTGIDFDYEEFLDLLDEYLSSMEHSRTSAEEILAAIKSFHVWELYVTLFTQFYEFLTADERIWLIERYKSVFDVPMPGITD